MHTTAFLTRYLPVMSRIGRTEYQLLLTKASDRGEKVLGNNFGRLMNLTNKSSKSFNKTLLTFKLIYTFFHLWSCHSWPWSPPSLVLFNEVLPLCFKCHFPGVPGLAGIRNHHHQQTNIQLFLQAGCPSCRPTNSVKALKGTV